MTVKIKESLPKDVKDQLTQSPKRIQTYFEAQLMICQVLTMTFFDIPCLFRIIHPVWLIIVESSLLKRLKPPMRQ